MALLTKAPRGTTDVLPSQSERWQYVEKAMRTAAQRYGYNEIRTPTFEHTELFNRSVGDTTDVVQKEMYTFEDKGNRSITLRPEGTAGVVRAILEHGLLGDALPAKVSYFTNCFRYEKPQAGRLREFHQFGVEVFGAASAAADAEVIAIAHTVLQSLGIDNVQLEINSIGCPECRKDYHAALRAYFDARKDELCETCQGRLEKNPMRILDCKSPICKEIAAGAPKAIEFLCGDCQAHFEQLKANLDAIGIGYVVNPTIVRGLDYYTRTVFEFVATGIGAQSTVCGGGRYDGLIEQMGGAPTPGLGFGMGIERVLLAMEQCGAEIPREDNCLCYIGSMGEKAALKAMELTELLRSNGYFAACDLMGRSVKAQMKYADKVGAMFSVILGDNELETKQIRVKNMAEGVSADLKLDGAALMEYLDGQMVEAVAKRLQEAEE